MKGDPGTISDETKELLENYSKIPADEVLPHLRKTVCLPIKCSPPQDTI